MRPIKTHKQGPVNPEATNAHGNPVFIVMPAKGLRPRRRGVGIQRGVNGRPFLLSWMISRPRQACGVNYTSSVAGFSSMFLSVTRNRAPLAPSMMR